MPVIAPVQTKIAIVPIFGHHGPTGIGQRPIVIELSLVLLGAATGIWIYRCTWYLHGWWRRGSLRAIQRRRVSR